MTSDDLEKPKTINQDKDTDEAQGHPLRDIPEWLDDSTENLVEDKVPSSMGRFRQL